MPGASALTYLVFGYLIGLGVIAYGYVHLAIFKMVSWGHSEAVMIWGVLGSFLAFAASTGVWAFVFQARWLDRARNAWQTTHPRMSDNTRSSK